MKLPSLVRRKARGDNGALSLRTICGFRTIAQNPKINYLDIGDRAAMKRIPTLAILKRELAQAADPGRKGCCFRGG